jgi:hypothetical protein
LTAFNRYRPSSLPISRLDADVFCSISAVALRSAPI